MFKCSILWKITFTSFPLLWEIFFFYAPLKMLFPRILKNLALFYNFPHRKVAALNMGYSCFGKWPAFPCHLTEVCGCMNVHKYFFVLLTVKTVFPLGFNSPFLAHKETSNFCKGFLDDFSLH